MLAIQPSSLLIVGLLAAGFTVAASVDDAPSEEAAAIDRAYTSALDRARRTAARAEFRVDHSNWADPWVVRSEHYEVRTTQGRGYALGRAEDLELMLSSFQDVLGTDFAPRTPFVVLIHPTLELYQAYGNQYSDARSSIFGGYFDPQNPGGTVATLFDTNLTLERMFLTHGACQQFLDRAFPGTRVPAALTQGLGAYFQASWNYGYFVDRFESLRDGTDGRALIPLEDLLGAPLGAYTDRAEDRFFQLAMVFVYLRAIREDTRSTLGADGRVETVGPFDEYVRLAVRGQSTEDHPVQELLTEGLDVLDEEIRAFRGWR